MVKLDHVRIAVRDWRASRDWYQRTFGFRVEFEVADGGDAKLGVAAMQDDGGLTLFLDHSPGNVPVCSCVLYFQVQEVDDNYRKLSSAGVRFRRGPQKFYWGYGAELGDPDGHVIRIWDEKSMQADEEQQS